LTQILLEGKLILVYNCPMFDTPPIQELAESLSVIVTACYCILIPPTNYQNNPYTSNNSAILGGDDEPILAILDQSWVNDQKESTVVDLMARDCKSPPSRDDFPCRRQGSGTWWVMFDELKKDTEQNSYALTADRLKKLKTEDKPLDV
jgi:hypothetical protein